MACRSRVAKILCCCISGSAVDNLIKKKKREHKYCGCKESSQQRNRKMLSGDVDRRNLVENEVFEALDYDFVSKEESEECVINNPVVPFTHVLTSVLHPSSDIIIQGVLHEKATRFAINLLISCDDGADIAFHFNPRLDQLYSARNSRFDGSWGPEEGNSQQKFPFHRGEDFYLEVYLTHAEFMVSVNGIHYCSYTYRTSLLNITNLQVIGDVTLSLVRLHSSCRYPSQSPPECRPCLYRFALPDNATTKNISEITPVYGLLQANLTTDSKIEINGKVKLLPYSFYVNLQEGADIWPHPEIPLHISVRFNQGGDHVILANAWTVGSSWGREELTHTKCLFTPGHNFVLQIACTEDMFVAKVDNQTLLSFKHRIPFRNIDTLHIQGDVFIYKISVKL